MRFDWVINMSKTAAGSAAPVWNVRLGTNGTTADTSVASFTGPSQTAAVSTAAIQFTAIITTTGASGKLFIYYHLLSGSGNATTGITAQGGSALTSAIDLTVSSSFLGISVAPGASSAWTNNNILTTITF
jgi:hypothetical protein